MCVWVHMYVQVRVHLHVCAHACGGQRTTLSVVSDTESLPGSEFTKYSFCTISYTVWTCSVWLWRCVPIVSGLRDTSGRLGVQGYILSYIIRPRFTWAPQDPYKNKNKTVGIFLNWSCGFKEIFETPTNLLRQWQRSWLLFISPFHHVLTGPFPDQIYLCWATIAINSPVQLSPYG